MTAVCADKSKFQGILHILRSFLGLPRKSDKPDAMVDSTGAVFMTDVQNNAFFTTVKKKSVSRLIKNKNMEIGENVLTGGLHCEPNAQQSLDASNLGKYTL